MATQKTIIIDNEETNYEISSDGKVFNKKTGRELKGTYARNEYHSVQLTINGKPKTFMVHRLVASHFCENPNNYTIVDHIDRNKLNNDYTNLRWVDNSTNVKNVGEKGTIKITKFQGTLDGSWKEARVTDLYCNEDGLIVNKKTNHLLKGSLRNNYIRITLPDGKHKSAHIIIWEAFNGPIPEGMVIDHIDGNRSNNKLSNLRLVTQSENMKNAQINGHKGQVKISQYDSNGNFIAKYDSIREASIAINGNEYAIKQAADRFGKSAGYFWIRDDQNITIEEVLKKTTSGKPKSSYIGVTQYDKEGNEIAHYQSLGDAAKAVNGTPSTIKRAADDQRIGKGYYWILDNQQITINDLLTTQS